MPLDSSKRDDEKSELRRVRKRKAAAERERQQFEPILNECIRLGMPGTKTFEQNTVGEDLAIDIYDDTGSVGLSEFASRMVAGAVPTDQRWIELEAGFEVDEADRVAVNRDLAEINEYLFERIFQSNFSSEIHPAFLNMGISTGALMVETAPHALFHHTALPLTESYFTEDAYGRLTGCFRERMVPAYDLELMFPKGEFSKELERRIDDEEDKPLKLIEHTWQDITAGGTDEATRKMTWIDDRECHLIENENWKGIGASPFLGFRSGKAAGEVWGRGPFMTALPSIRTLNQVFELMLQSAALQLVPMFHIDDSEDLNAETIRVEPGALIPKRRGSDGLQKIETGAGDIRIADIFQQIEGTKIKRALFNDMLSDPNKTPATATEVAERAADLANRMSAQLGRIHYELISPYIMRVIWLAQEAGHIKLPVVNGRAVRVKAVSPLARAIGQRDMQNLMNYHQVSASLLGPMVASSQYDEKELLTFLRDRLMQHERNFVPIDQLTQKAAAMTAAQSMGVPAGGAEPAPLQAPA